MTSAAPPPADPRFEPHAARPMAAMFDDVSPRYDLLNAIMTLGRDSAWREAMWREVPDDARVVLDLCTGTGTSLRGLRRPGRLVIGADVSMGMLKVARDEEGWLGWAPRLVAADAFRLPLRDGSVDCVTIAFGIRNLRPRGHALAEIRRVLKPGGRLVVLEATAPSPGPLAPLHRFHLLHVLPLLGRLSPDPTAYAYLGRSIVDFGSAPTFSDLMRSQGFAIDHLTRFLMGATHLWTATAPGGGAATAAGSRIEQRRRAEWRAWTALQLIVALGILAVVGWATASFWRIAPDLPIEHWQRTGMRVVLAGGVAGFAIRSIVLMARLFGAPPRD